MKVNLAEVYQEVDVEFELSDVFFRALWNTLEEALMQQQISDIQKMFRGPKDFTLGFLISTTRKNKSLEVKGPTFFQRRRWVDFVMYIPYRRSRSFTDMAEYVLENVGEGVASTVESYQGTAIR